MRFRCAGARRMSKTRAALIGCLLLLSYASFIVYPRWQQPQSESALGWDVAGYYWYLPSVFIYHDLKGMAFSAAIRDRYAVNPELPPAFRHPGTGNYVLRYSCGTALAMLPAFGAAHLYCKSTGKAPADGFSKPYQLALQVWWVLIALGGLVLYGRFLRRYHSDAVAAWVLLLLVFASNYLNWAAIDVGQTHSLLFTLYAALLLLTEAFHRRPGLLRGAAIGLLTGFMTLVRPSEIIAILIPLLWGLESAAPKALKGRAQWLWHQRGALLAAAAAGTAVLSLQLAYWKYVSGEWIVYSYGDQGFSFLHPHFRQYTFDWAHGWLIYAPVMAFAAVGILPFLKNGRNKAAVLAFTLLNYYLVASWDLWQYGSRAMIQSYPVMGLLLAALVAWVLRQSWRRIVFVPVFAVLVYYNFWWTYFAHGSRLWPGAPPQHENLLDTELMTESVFPPDRRPLDDAVARSLEAERHPGHLRRTASPAAVAVRHRLAGHGPPAPAPGRAFGRAHVPGHPDAPGPGPVAARLRIADGHPARVEPLAPATAACAAVPGRRDRHRRGAARPPRAGRKCPEKPVPGHPAERPAARLPCRVSPGQSMSLPTPCRQRASPSVLEAPARSPPDRIRLLIRPLGSAGHAGFRQGPTAVRKSSQPTGAGLGPVSVSADRFRRR